MDAVERYIARYHTVPFNNCGEAWGKVSVLGALEKYLSDQRVLDFFLTIIGAPDEYDMARLEALKILQLWDPPSERVRIQVGRLLAKVLSTEEDVLVQQWAAIAAENFVEVPEVSRAVLALLADTEANLDVRHNCLAAVRRLRWPEQVFGVLVPLASDPQLGEYIRRILNG